MKISDSFRNSFKILSDRKVSLSFSVEPEFEEKTDMLDLKLCMESLKIDPKDIPCFVLYTRETDSTNTEFIELYKKHIDIPIYSTTVIRDKLWNLNYD